MQFSLAGLSAACLVFRISPVLENMASTGSLQWRPTGTNVVVSVWFADSNNSNSAARFLQNSKTSSISLAIIGLQFKYVVITSITSSRWFQILSTKHRFELGPDWWDKLSHDADKSRAGTAMATSAGPVGYLHPVTHPVVNLLLLTRLAADDWLTISLGMITAEIAAVDRMLIQQVSRRLLSISLSICTLHI